MALSGLTAFCVQQRFVFNSVLCSTGLLLCQLCCFLAWLVCCSMPLLFNVFLIRRLNSCFVQHLYCLTSSLFNRFAVPRLNGFDGLPPWRPCPRLLFQRLAPKQLCSSVLPYSRFSGFSFSSAAWRYDDGSCCSLDGFLSCLASW